MYAFIEVSASTLVGCVCQRRRAQHEMASRVAHQAARRCAAIATRHPPAFGYHNECLSSVRSSISTTAHGSLLTARTSQVWRLAGIQAMQFSSNSAPKIGPINEDINARVVNVVDADGSTRRNMPLEDALYEAKRLGVDLVQVANNGEIFCRMFNAQKRLFALKKAGKTSKPKPSKEVNFGVKTEAHDLKTKAAHVREFLSKGHKVKVTVKFGKEFHLQEKAFEQLRLIEEAVGTEHGTRDAKIVQMYGGISSKFTPKSK